MGLQIRFIFQKIVLLATVIFCFSIQQSYAQKNNSTSKRQKQLAKQQENKKEEIQKEHDAAQKHFMDIQSKSTKKNMKKLHKRANKYNKKRKKQFFLFRWFSDNADEHSNSSGTFVANNCYIKYLPTIYYT